MADALSAKHRAIISGFLALVQLAGALTTGVTFALGDNGLLTTASAAFTCVVLLVNRWYFRGWREFHLARRNGLAAPSSRPPPQRFSDPEE